MRPRLVGTVVGLACVAALGAAMLSVRGHLAVSTTALVLVIPVVVAAAVGGFVAGLASVAAGFLVFDYLFIPPFQTLNVGTLQNWTALLVYFVVMLLVARVVARLDLSRVEAERGGAAARRLSELSELLVGDRPVGDLLDTIVRAIHTAFEVPGVALLVLDEGELRVAASAGAALTLDELSRLDPHSGVPVSLGVATDPPGGLRTIALVASGRPLGMLALRGLPAAATDRAVLTTFANDASLAIERARLREQALRTQLLEEVDRFRQGLLGAVSHDLRTPLATIKVASSTLSNRSRLLDEAQSAELYGLIEVEADRLTRLVTNLLDMTRIEAGVLEVRRAPVAASQLVKEAVASMGPALEGLDVVVDVAASLPEIDVDALLVGQVLINLLDNAARHSPAGGRVTVDARLNDGTVRLAVSDEGPGVAPADRDAVFDRFTRFDAGGHSGLGLTIARTFVEAHGSRVWCEDAVGGGARFVVELPVARFEGGEA